MKIDAEMKSLKEILVTDDIYYQVPNYQRPYSWDKDNLSDLIDDLFDAYLANRDGDNATNRNKSYFCGSLVLVKKDGNEARFDIIDGQQRVTTFTIISCVFRDYYGDHLNDHSGDYVTYSIKDRYDDSIRKLKFLTDKQFQIDFENTVLSGIDNTPANIKGNKYLENAHHLKFYIQEKIDDTELGIDINKFIIWYFDNVVLTVITCPSEEDAIRIFNVLNARGMPLSPVDILKSSLMQELNDDDDREAFKLKWDKINENLEYADHDLSGMLTAYVYCKTASNPKERFDKVLIKQFKKDGNGTIDVIQVITEMSDFSKAYIDIYNEQCKYIYCLRYLKHEIYWSSILATAKFLEYPYIEELKKLLVAYYYQNWIAGATSARIKQTSFNILKHIRNQVSIDHIKFEMKSNLDKHSTTKYFKDQVQSSHVYNEGWDKAILLSLNYFFTEGEVVYTKISKKLHIEHVLPQTASHAYWTERFAPEDIVRFTHSLANLTLLSCRKNIQSQNYPFQQKKDVYWNADGVTTPFTITQHIANSDVYGEWNIEAIEKRKGILLNKIMCKLDLFDS